MERVRRFQPAWTLAAHSLDKVNEMLTKFHAVIRALVATNKVTVAAVHGHCLGGGAELAMVCDIVYTAESAQWGFPEIKLGCYPPVACTALGALVGQKAGCGVDFDWADDRAEKGQRKLVWPTRAVPESELAAAMDPKRIGQLRRVSVRRRWHWPRRRHTRGTRCILTKGWPAPSRIYFDELMKTSDAQEGVRAFMEKREPKWTTT